MDVGKTLYARDRKAFRRWLEKHHDSAPDIWLIFYSKNSEKPSIAYDDAVEEALCFGWIDSIVKKHGPESRAQRFSPRRANSPLSETNKERARRLIERGLMTPAGLAAAGDLSTDFVVPRDIIRELKRDAAVWANFQAFPESYKRIRVGWITSVRKQRPDEADKRLRYFIKMTKENKMYGTVR